MAKGFRKSLWVSASALAMWAVPATAQDQASDDTAVEGESGNVIIVTATRRAEGVQDIPASVQVLGGETIDTLQLDSFEDILPQVAGVGFSRSGSGATQIGIRGVSNVIGTEFGSGDSVSPVGIYFDDTPIQGGGSLLDLALYDLERVEVLKGPQGTLFGEGAMGGVIRFIPNGANNSDWEAKAEATISGTRFGGTNYLVRGVINAPIIQDAVGLRITGTYREDEGYIDNIATGENNVNDLETWGIRAILDAELASWLDVRLTYVHDETELVGFDNYNPNIGDLQVEFLENRFNETEVDLFSGTIEADLGFGTLSSITSYIEDTRIFNERVDLGVEFVVGLFSGGFVNVPVPARSNLTNLEQEAFTQEFRLVSEGDNRLDWVIGAFYRDRELQTRASALIDNAQAINDATTAVFGPFGDPFLFPTPSSVGSFTPAPFLAVVDRTAPETFEQYAIYGELNYEITDDLEFTVGARYFDEETTLDDDVTGYGYLFIVSADPDLVRVQDDGLLLKFALDYALNDDVLLYATAAEGFRSGGGNGNASFDLSGTVPPSYGSDSLWNYEAGIKSAWMNNSLILNAAFYYLDWTDIQTNVTTGFVNTTTGPRQLTFIDGTSDAEIYGLEVELTYLPTDDLSFGFNMNLQDAQFTSTDPEGSIVPDTDLPRAPDINIGGYVQYTPALTDSLTGLVRFDLNHTGSALDLPITDGSDLFPVPPALTELDAFTMGRARVGVAGDNWSFDLFVDNLFDERPVIGVSPFFQSFQAGDFAVTTIRPPTFGATVRVNY